ncbi:hypothetical protein EDB83DRAFT_2520846 [Lactarius deliciosus]|nr:hypothetical protein EDB83DRAFT_2520846 [Lactarius deliciosus]
MSDSGTSHTDSPPDWSQFSSLWDNDQPQNVKFDPTAFDFSLNLPLGMDLDFDSSSLAIDPSALHFDPKMFATDLTPFQPQQLLGFPQSLPPRRMSITSSSSSSGASLSDLTPLASMPSIPSTAATSPHLSPGVHVPVHVPVSVNDPVDELAQSVRQTSGVTLAVPVQGQAEQLTFSSMLITALGIYPPDILRLDAQKLPIPRLQRHSPPATNAGSKRKSPAAEPSPSPDPALGGTVAIIGRPKTSHTTIERRYRTNLNARIQSLKDAVPALRVLETKEKANKVDERGFVDGIKVARKISKANVLGKAAEYIHVLKRRENRLKREQAGLRSLISGLVGGPALLREWEREWVSRFGGPERDEATSDISDDDDGADDGESDADDDNLHPKKRIKGVPKKPAKDPKPKKETNPGIVPEKRKRGRPRKVQPLPEGDATQPQDVATPLVQAQQKQYLLAVFSFFSFFNSPLTSYSRSSPTHTGVVLADSGVVLTPTAPASTFGWREVLQVFHLVVSGLVFLSILLPFLPKSIPRLLTHFSSSNFPRTDAAKRIALIEALDSSRRGTPDEATLLRTALGVYPGFLGLLLSFAAPKRGGKTKTLEHKQLEQRAWVRLAELAVFDRATSLGLRSQAYWGMVSHTPAFATSPGDLSTLALLVFPVWRARATALWTRANHARLVRPFERAVIGAMTVEEASASLAKTCNVRLSPLSSLAVRNVRKAVAHVAARTFVDAVLGPDVQSGDTEKDAREEVERRAVIDAGRSLGGRSAELVDLLERIYNGAFVRHEEIDHSDDFGRRRGGTGHDYFPPRYLGPQAFPSYFHPHRHLRAEMRALRAALRVALDAEVFYGGGSELEEARDHVIDTLVDVDRASRRRV